MNTPRYLRFVQALALAAVVPACGEVSEPAAAQPDVAQTSAPVADAATDAAPATDAALATDAAAAFDSGYPHASGPIVPPELPAGFA